MNRNVRVVFVIVGVVMIVYALFAVRIIPGIPFALLVIGGVLLIWAGYGARIKRIP
jgi:hypothetical protein